MILHSQTLFLRSSYKRVLPLFLLYFFLFSHFNELKAQWLYEIDGTVTSGTKKLDGAIITLFKGTTQAQQVSTPANGKFSVNLEPEFDYTLTVTKPGFITKKLLFSTKGVPTDIAKNFEGGAKPEISIFEIPKDPAVVSQVNSILSQPMAKFLYDPTEQDIVFDKEYSESMLQELNRLNQLEKEVKKKLEEESKNQQLTAAATESKYNAAISKGDAAFSKKDYTNAKTAYQDALTIKKGEGYPLGKIVEIEKLLADANKNAQQEADYKTAIARGDQAFSGKNYDVAKGGYTDALKIKPSESYPKSKLDEIARLLADANKNKDLDAKYDAAIAKADKAFAAKTYDVAKISYSEALTLKSSEKYPKAQLAEIDRLLNELNAKNKSAAELLEKYKASIAKADKAFSAKDYSNAKNIYKEASGYQPTEAYPKDKMAEIDKLLAELANKDASEKERQAKEKELNAKYDAIIAKADKSLSGKDYAGAKNAYKEALGLKSAEQYPKDKINEIDKLLASLAGKEAEEKNRLQKENEINDKYNIAIAAGDKAMGGKDYNTAKSSYTAALVLKANEKYPKTKLDEIDKLLAGANELNAKYIAAIAKGDAALKGKVYDDAKKAYKEALSYKSTEQYPKDKLAEIDGLLAKESGAKELDAKYNSIISKADKALSGKDYANAKSSYTEALDMKPAEAYPKTKLAEIEKAMADAAKALADKDREVASKAAADKDRLAREKALNEKYAAAIAKADAAFATKQYGPSKAAYTEAYGIKPAEQYPKDKINEIDKLLAAADKELEQKYKTALAKADAAFAIKDYPNARTAYVEATGIKATDPYPKDQVTKIDMLLAEANKDKELKTKYTAAITSGDANMAKKDYPAALLAFKEAQGLRPSEPYPNNKISEINNLLDGLARSKEKDKQYADLIIKADKSFASKDYKVAKGSYLDASLIKPTERYPKTKVIEIDNILNPKTVAPVVTNKAMEDFRNDLAKKYPQGITEESGTEGNLKVVRRIVVNGADAHLYLKKTTSFGAIYYFKDDVSITEKEFVSSTEIPK
jgi:hypothetical protein